MDAEALLLRLEEPTTLLCPELLESSPPVNA
jgi:hypothetical protein